MKVIKLTRSLCFLSLTLSFLGCNSSHDGRGDKTSLRSVYITRPVALSDSRVTSYSGVVEEGTSVNASFMADGKVGDIYVKEGDRVRKGQLLARLDDSDYVIGVSQLEAQFNQMTKEKERMDAMFEKHNISPNDYEKFSAGYEQMRLQLEMAKRKLDYTRLYAPVSGYIAAKYINPGELTGAGTPVFNIVDDSQLVASVDLPVSVYLDRKNILSASGTVPGIQGEIPLHIVSFTPDVDNNMLYHLKLSVPGNFAKELSPGMNISVSLTAGENAESGALIPSRAIFDDNGKTFVWVYNALDSTISKQAVTVKGRPVDRMSVVEGVTGSEEIVEVGVKQLYEGEKVKVITRETSF